MTQPTATENVTEDNDSGITGMATRILAGERRALARAITLVESARPDHAHQADQLLGRLLAHTGKALRLGVTGVPGVGKSTFIEALGLMLIAMGHRPAILTIDPSSPRTGGSILGDKTRMDELSRRPEAYIRPSPSGGTLGGVARRTREAALLCEAAGHDIVIIETVGVGQSETAVSRMVDVFLLLLVPGGGDELQGIKKGVVELADLVVVNKADGDLLPAAERARREYASALHLLARGPDAWQVPVLTCSSVERQGLDQVWAAVSGYYQRAKAEGWLEKKRSEQARGWMWTALEDAVLSRLKATTALSEKLRRMEDQVARGDLAPGAAAQVLLAGILGTEASDP